jgi:hypothetical protein
MLDRAPVHSSEAPPAHASRTIPPVTATHRHGSPAR